MKKKFNSAGSVLLSVLIVMLALTPGFVVFSANPTITITDSSGNEITERQEVQEYRSVQLSYTLSQDAPEGAYVGWESNLPLLADVDDTGKVTGYDYSKKAIIQKWLDENIRTLPLVGDTMADSIMSTLENTGVDLDDMNNDLIVSIVRGIAGDALADSLKTALDNMNVVITATLYDSDGKELSSDTAEFVVTKSLVASVAPTGVHITNKKSVPTVVAVGATVQLYGAVSPVRLKQNVKWSMGSNAFDTNSSKYANVSDDGLVTFTAAGTATVRANPENTLYAAFSDTVTFTVVDASELPVTDFSITGTTTVSEGATTQLSISDLTPSGAYTGDLVWSSADPTIAVVDQNGIVTGLDGGSGLIEYSKSTTITATIGTVSKSVTVKVSRSGVTGNLSSVEISGEAVIANDTSAQYTANVFPSRLNSNSSVSREWGIVDNGATIWATSVTPAVSSLGSITADGVLTPAGSGIITIAARASYNGNSVETTKQITMGNAITDFSISGTLSVTENSTTQLSVSGILPTDYDEAILSTIKWSSDNPSAASVDENGIVKGLDAGGYGTFNSKKVNITATIGGVSKTVTVTVKGSVINYVTSASINGSDYVIKDFPVQYSSAFTPARMSISQTLWGLPNDEGAAPWTASNTLSSSNNMSNEFASVTDAGLVSGVSAGQTTLYLFGRHLLTSHAETTKNITVVELEPESITVTSPAKKNYVEGETELDLSGLKVQLTYNRSDIEQYYPDSSSITDAQLTVDVTDFTVSPINQNILDNEQYIVVTVTRAGKDYRGVFAINLESKALTGIEITPPQYKYLEGTTALDLTGLTVKANYSNAESEFVTDYTVDTTQFNPQLFNTEQNITVTYTHAGRSASAEFPVIVYGIPVVSVDTGDYQSGWTSNDVTFTLDSTNKLDGITYYYTTNPSGEWTQISGNTYTVSTNSSLTYYFKAINSEGIESEPTVGYTVSRDDITPDFSLTQGITSITNQSYDVTIDSLSVGASGVKTVTLNDSDITGATAFTVNENGDYTVIITANNGLSKTHILTVNNIDKDAPEVTAITMEHKNTGGFARVLSSITFGKFFNEQIEITITATDTGVAGVDTIEYRFLDENGLPTGNDWKVYNNSNKPVQDPNFKGFVEARATDRAGNVSVNLRSDGYVIDGDNPSDVLLNATYNGNKYENNTWVADSVNITMTSSAFSDIFEYRYRIDGGEWQSVTGNSIVAQAEGEHLYEFKAISNAALDSEITSLTVKIDRQVPVVRVAFKGTFGRWTGDDVTFDFSTLEQSLSGITYYYNNGNGWVEITSGDSIVLTDSVNATYQFKAANGAGTQSNTSDSYDVMIDNVIPTVTPVQAVTEPTSEPYNINITTSSGDAGIKSVTLNGEDITGKQSVKVSQNGNYLFTVTGNNGKMSTCLVVVDNFYNPVLEVTAINFDQVVSGSFARKTDGEFGTFYKENTEVTISAQNSGVTGVAKIEYRLLDENKAPLGEWQTYDPANKPVLTSGFRGYVEARAYDNTTAVSQSFVSKSLVVDTALPTVPVITATTDGTGYSGEWTGKDVTFTLSSSAFSGIYEYMFRTDGGEWKHLSGNSVTVSDNGEHTYEFKAVSNATLESLSAQFSAKIENIAPVLQVGVNGTIGAKTGDDVKFSLYAPNVISGVDYYCNNGNGWVKLDTDTVTVSQTITADYKFKAVNKAGVESFVSPDYKVIIDKDYELVERKPVLQVGVNGTLGEFTSGAVTFTLSSGETKGDVVYYYNDGTGFKAMSGSTLTISSDTDKSYTFKVTDSTNRESLVSQPHSVKIDKTAPTVKLVAQPQLKPNDTVKVNINTTSGLSGIKSITLNGADITGETSFDVSLNGSYSVTVTSNNGLTTTDVIEFSCFDREAPQINDLSLKQINTGSFARFINTMTFGLFFNEKVEITATASDNGSSGVKNIEYRLLDENKGTLKDWSAYDESAKPTVDTQFKGFVEVRATDNAGNVSQAVSSDGFIIDMTAPRDVVVTATTPDGVYDGSFTDSTVTMALSSTAFSDIYEYRYRIDGGEWASLTGNTLTALDGVHTYEFKAVSYSNNESAVTSFVTKVETGTPALSVNTSGVFGVWTTENITFSLSATNTSSGVTYYYNDGSGFKAMSGNMLTVDKSVNKTYTFKAINGTGAESAVSDSYSVMIDKEVPSVSVSADTTDYTNKDVEIRLSADTTGISGVQSVTMNGNDITGVSKVTVSENGTYTFTVTANNGLTSSQSVTVNNIDKTSPDVIGVSFTHQNGLGAVKDNIFANNAVVNIAAFDSGVSGIEKIEYRVNKDNTLARSLIWKDYDENDRPLISGDFTGTVEVRVTDKAGNVSQVFTSDNVIVDSHKPEDITLTAVSGSQKYQSGEWTKDNVTISLQSSAYSGIDAYLYKVDNGEWQKLDGSTLTVSDNGIHSFKFKAVSSAGLESEITSFATAVESETPVLTVTPYGTLSQWTDSDVSFMLSATNTQSGITYYVDDGDGFKKLDGNLLILNKEQNKVYTFKAVNGVGNESAMSDEYTVMIDEKGPSSLTLNAVSGTDKIASGSTVNKDVYFDLSANAFSDIAKYQYSLNGADWLDANDGRVSTNGDGTYNYKFRAVSNSGVVSDETQFSITVDKNYSASQNQGGTNNTIQQITNGVNNAVSQITGGVDIPKTGGEIASVSILPLGLATVVIAIAAKKRSKK